MYSRHYLLTKKECDTLVSLFKQKEETTFRLDWDSEDRHQRLLLIDLDSDIARLVFERLLINHPLVEDDLQLQHFEPHLVELFVSRYMKGEGVGWHNDRRYYESESPILNERVYNFSINLNDDYEGGQLRLLGETIPNAPIGDCTMFSIKDQHSVSKVTDGVRYSLIGWMYKRYQG